MLPLLPIQKKVKNASSKNWLYIHYDVIQGFYGEENSKVQNYKAYDKIICENVKQNT